MARKFTIAPCLSNTIFFPGENSSLNCFSLLLIVIETIRSRKNFLVHLQFSADGGRCFFFFLLSLSFILWSIKIFPFLIRSHFFLWIRFTILNLNLRNLTGNNYKKNSRNKSHYDIWTNFVNCFHLNLIFIFLMQLNYI